MPSPLTRIPPNTEQTLTRQGNAIQRNARQTATAVDGRGSPPVVVGPFTFTAGQTLVISHGLMRVPEEWYPIDITGSYASFFRTGWDERTITIVSGTVCTAKFRVA